MARYLGTLAAAAGAVALLAPGFAGAVAPDTNAQQLDIPAGPLAPALEAFSVQSRQQLLYSPSVVDGKRSSAVHGRLTAHQALNRLLSGTTLSWRASAGGTILLTAMQSAAPPSVPTPEARPAQAPPAPLLPSADAAAPLQDIVVTARRKSESLQRTPVSITAFTGADLYKRSITRASDLQAVTPGLQIGYSAFRTNPTIALRGQRRSSIGEGAPAVLIYQDEVPLPPLGSLIPTYDVSSIQVLKGPQGTLFGRNATAGAILIYTAPPTYNLEGYANLRVGNYADREIEGALNLPIVDQKIALRLAGQVAQRDGYTKNLGSGPDLDDRNDASFRASLLLQPFTTLKNVTVFDTYHADEAGTGTILYNLYPNATSGGGNARIPALAPFFDCGTSINCDVDLQLARQRAIGPRKFYSDTPAYVRTNLRGVVNTTTFSPSDKITLKNIFGYRSVHIDYLFDLDGTPLRLIQSQQTTRTEQLTDELQASGKLFQDKLDWIVGGFYLDDHPTGINGQALAVLSPGTKPPAVTAMTYRHTLSKAVYGQIGYDLSSLIHGLKFNAGIRRTTDKPSLCATATPAGQPLRTEQDCKAVATTIRTKFSATTWTLGLDWQVSRDLFLYVTSRRGYRSGGLNTPILGTAIASLQYYAPETITDVEIGLKANGRIAGLPYRFAVDAYRGWYKGIQRNYTLPPNFDGDNNPANDPGTGLVVNSGDAILQGVEFDALIQPVRDLSLSVSGAYTNAYYTKLQVSPVLQSAGLIPANAIDNVFPYVPSWTYGAGIEYSPQIGRAGQLLLRGDFYHSDSFFLNERPANDPAVKVKQYSSVNVRAGLLNIAGTGIDATLFANNLFDKTYVVGSGNFAPALTFVSAIYGPPRMYGLELRYHFSR